MRLSTMRAVVEGCTADGEWPAATTAAHSWSADPGEVRFFRASSNAIFTLSGEPDAMLRFTPAQLRSYASVVAEVDAVVGLHSGGLHVARPLAALDGTYVRRCQTDAGPMHVTAFERLRGVHLRSDDLDLSQARAWGESLSRLHAIVDQPTQSVEGHSLDTWEHKLRHCGRALRRQFPALHARFEKVCGDLVGITDVSEEVVLHGDYELDNLIWLEGRFYSIDHEDIMTGPAVVDIALAVRDLFDDRAQLFNARNRWFAAFVDGYRQNKSLSDEALRLIPALLRLHTMENLLKVSAACDDTGSSQPEWLRQLETRLGSAVRRWIAELEV